ncbi:MAG: SDR family oxidoreductase [Actinomycetota bacterium]
MGRLDGRVALITGGASGIGEATARRFVDEGASVVLADLQDDRGQALAAELGAAARFAHCDVRDEDDQAGAAALAVEAFGRLDIAIANAGIVGVTGPFAETPLDAWRFSVDVLLTGAFLTMREAAKVMIPQGSGVILATSSTAGVQGGLGPHAYTAAKHGVVGLVKTASSELLASGIRVNGVAPTGMVTPLTADVSVGDANDLDRARAAMSRGRPLGRAGEADDVANAFLFLASDEGGYVSGHTLVIDAGDTTGGSAARFASQDTAVLREAGGRGVRP